MNKDRESDQNLLIEVEIYHNDKVNENQTQLAENHHENNQINLGIKAFHPNLLLAKIQSSNSKFSQFFR